MNAVSAAIMLFLVFDPLGNIPIFLSQLGRLDPKRARQVIVRELLFAYLVLVVFLFGGRYILELLQISEATLGVSGGVILFLIALKMVFGYDHGGPEADAPEPFLVPLAIPLVAGPSALATVMLLVAKQPERWPEWLAALTVAWAAAGAILLAARAFSRALGVRGLLAMERLMGMILTALAIEMTLKGLRAYFATPLPAG
ncbi:MAG TPA: MarC family protein [Planctomycetia bacterium]|nr:MarC family protein [Planctomycetia bacterium]